MKPYGLGKLVGCSCCNDNIMASKYRGRCRKHRKARVKHRQKVNARREGRDAARP